MRLAPNKEIDQLLRKVKKQGATIRRLKGGHIAVEGEGRDRVIVAASPCNVGITKTRSRLRRAGWGV